MIIKDPKSQPPKIRPAPPVAEPVVRPERPSIYSKDGQFVWSIFGDRWVPVASPKVMDAVAGVDRTITTLQPGDALDYVFGETVVVPKIITAQASGDYLYIDFFLSYGECEEIAEIYRDNESIGKPLDSAKWEYFLGTAGQSPSALMTSAVGATYDALPNICHFVARLSKGESWNFKVRLKGIKTRDPRLSPVAAAYSANPALALGRVLEDLGYTVDDASLTAAADYCDEDVGGSNRWELHLPIQTRQTAKTWVEALSKYASCYVNIDNGVAKFVLDAPVTSSPAINRAVTSEDMVEGSAQTEKVGTRSVPEQVTVQYRDEDGANRTATAGAGNPGERTRLQMPGFKTYTMARRFATQTYNLARADLRHSHVAHDEALADEIGDVHSVTYAPHGLSNKLMRLVGLREISRGRFERDYVEYDAALYNDQVFTAPSVSDTDLTTPNSPPNGPSATVVEELYTDSAAGTYSRLKITFTGVSWPFVQAYKVKADGEQNVLNALISHDGAGETHTVYTAALKQGVVYTVQVWVQSNTGVLSDTPSSTTATAQGKLLPPGDVPSLTAYEAGNLVAMSWGAAEEIDGDLRGYIIKRLPEVDYTGTSADWTNTNAVTIASRVDSTTYLTAAQPAGNYYYGVKGIDSFANESESATWRLVQVTSDASSVTAAELGVGVTANMHTYTIDGDAQYVVTSTGQTWADRFVDSPATWAGNASPSTERWGGDLAADSSFTTEVWDIGAVKTGNWVIDTSGVTLFGGTQSNLIQLGDNSSPIVYTNHSGSAVQASGQNLKFTTSTTDSPASPGDGLHIRLPIAASFSGALIEQSGTVTIAAASPLDNPKTVTFTTAYSSNPDITLTVTGAVPKIAAVDNVSTTGFDLYLWNVSGAKVDGVVNWYAEGT